MRFHAPRRHLLALGFFLFGASPALAFSNNNVRVDTFDWTHVQTEHFDIYYDKKTERLAPRMAHYLEGAWKDVGDKLDFYVPGRTPFFFYSNHNQFEQSTIVPIGEGTGGVTEAFKNRFLIFNDGSEEWLRHVIYHEFGHVVEFHVLYGGFWKSIRLLKSPFYPLWLMEGISEYVSGDVDLAESEMVIRDAVANKELPSLAELHGFSHLKPNQVTLGYKTGEAAMCFLADEYGEKKVGELLTAMKDHFDVASALNVTIGGDLTRFDFRFHEWVGEKYAAELAWRKPPTHYGPALTSGDGLPQFNESPVFSADGKFMYFFSDRDGPAQLYEKNLEEGTNRPLIGLRWRTFENLHTRGRALSISKDGRYLAFAGEKKQRDYLYVFDLKKKRLKRIRLPFDEIRSPLFSPVDDTLVCVGMEDGFNDLYLVARTGKVIRRLTDSPQDERDPIFTLDGRHILYSGEVMNEDKTAPIGRDLFRLSVDTSRVDRLTALSGAETEPLPLPDGSLVFVRDEDDAGSYGADLYLIRNGTEPARRLTESIGGAFTPTYNPVDGFLYYVGFYSGEKHVYRSSITVESRSEAVIAMEERDPADWQNRTVGASATSVTFVMDQWSDCSQSSLFVKAAAPYRFRASTDLFLPFFYYSSLDGLVLADLWQFSDYLGFHNLQQQMQYSSANDFIDLAVFYTYARFRPAFSVGYQATQFYRDFEQDRQRRETEVIGLMTYPLSRVNSVLLGIGSTDREDFFFDESEEDNRFIDRFWTAGYSYDTVLGRYLVPTRGRRMRLLYQEGRSAFGGEQEYRSGIFEATQYVPLRRESTIAMRGLYGRSVGEDSQVFRLGGVDRVRGLSRGSLENKKSNVVLANTELRLRIKYLDWRTKFLFPDFFFKAAYLLLFDDVGYGWDNRAERDRFKPREANNTFGVGITWPTFLLQTFQLHLTVQWAKSTTKGNDIWFVTVGPSF